MKSTKSLSYNITFFGIATHIPLRQRMPLLPPLVKVVENVIILIGMLVPLTLQTGGNEFEADLLVRGVPITFSCQYVIYYPAGS